VTPGVSIRGCVTLSFTAFLACSAGDERTAPPLADAGGPTSDAALDGSTLPDASGGAEAGDAVAPPYDADEAPAEASADAMGPCPPAASRPVLAGAAASTGFLGTADAYNALYGAPCTGLATCITACTGAGGTAASCAAGAQCVAGPVPDGGSMCLPPAYWINPQDALSQSGVISDASEITLTADGVADALVLTDFRVAVPDGAAILGIQFDVDRNADSGFAVDLADDSDDCDVRRAPR
jgi:hypothetical protein